MRLAVESMAEAREALRAVAEFLGDSYYVVQNANTSEVRVDVLDTLARLTTVRQQKQPGA